MAEDYENAINLDQMTDADVRDLVRERLEEDADFDVDAVEVTVADGQVTVEGRVGTEGELQRVDQVLTALGASDYENNVVVDPLTRAERSDAADVARVEDRGSQPPLGASSSRTSDTAEHLRPDPAADQYGTKDVQKAIQDGQAYTPPDEPVQEGFDGTEGSPGGERH